MKYEILTEGDIQKDLDRLGIIAEVGYEGEEYWVYQLDKENFDKLCKDAESPLSKEDKEKKYWQIGWRYGESNKVSDIEMKGEIYRSELTCWGSEELYEIRHEEWEEETSELEEDEIQDFEYSIHYLSLLDYLETELGVTTFRNICYLTTSLAKINNITLAELWRKYQGYI